MKTTEEPGVHDDFGIPSNKLFKHNNEKKTPFVDVSSLELTVHIL